MVQTASCIPKKKIRRVRLFSLDLCGRLLTTGNTVLDWDGFSELRWTNLIDDGDLEQITNVAGKYCVNDQACPIDRGVQVTFTECIENFSLQALTGHGSVVLQSAAVIGFNRQVYNCNTNLAMEVLFDTPSLCTGGSITNKALTANVATLTTLAAHGLSVGNVVIISGVDATFDGTYTLTAASGSSLSYAKTAANVTSVASGGAWYTGSKCVALLFPQVHLFKDVNERVADSKNTLRGSYTAQAVLNPNLIPTAFPTELTYWTPWLTDVQAGTNWYLERIVDCPVLVPAVGCELRAVA